MVDISSPVAAAMVFVPVQKPHLHARKTAAMQTALQQQTLLVTAHATLTTVVL